MDVPQHEEAARRVLEEMKGWEGGVRGCALCVCSFTLHAWRWMDGVCSFFFTLHTYMFMGWMGVSGRAGGGEECVLCVLSWSCIDAIGWMDPDFACHRMLV